jgi:hypothetical protein
MALVVLADSGCPDGTCPTFLIDEATGDVFVRGYDPDDPLGQRELDVRIPAVRWATLMAKMGN